MYLVTYMYLLSNLQYIKHHLDVQLDRIEKFITSMTSDEVARSDYIASWALGSQGISTTQVCAYSSYGCIICVLFQKTLVPMAGQ
jgi:hypothetical protein